MIFTAASIWQSLTNGFSAIAQIELPTNKVNTFVGDFVQAAQTYGEFDFALPQDYNGGTLTAIFYWIANSASANSVVWGIQGRAYADSNALDQAFGAAVEVTDANTGTNQVNISTTSAAITLAGAPAAGQRVASLPDHRGLGAAGGPAACRNQRPRGGAGRVAPA